MSNIISIVDVERQLKLFNSQFAGEEDFFASLIKCRFPVSQYCDNLTMGATLEEHGVSGRKFAAFFKHVLDYKFAVDDYERKGVFFFEWALLSGASVPQYCRLSIAGIAQYYLTCNVITIIRPYPIKELVLQAA